MPQRVVRYPWAGVLEGGTTKKPVGHICTPPAELPFLTVPLTALLRPCAPAPLRSAGSFIPQALRFSMVSNITEVFYGGVLVEKFIENLTPTETA